MATTSRVPFAVDALLHILRTSLALSEVQILDGPAVGNLTKRDRLYVGWQPTAENAVDLVQDFNAAGARTRDEDFTIACYAESRTGDKDMAIRRTRVFEIVAAAEAALRATEAAPEAPTLNGTVLWSHVIAGSLMQEQDQGALAGLNFTVACRARI